MLLRRFVPEDEVSSGGGTCGITIPTAFEVAGDVALACSVAPEDGLSSMRGASSIARLTESEVFRCSGG
jgi:hypothetical protein